jgi:nucleoside-diphosphate-sugar epimerase
VQLWYNVSKTLAEKAAWDFAGEEGLPLVVLNPSLVLGPTLTPAATPSQRLLMQLLGGRSFATFRVLQLYSNSALHRLLSCKLQHRQAYL